MATDDIVGSLHIAYKNVPLREDGYLQSGLGCIPGETESQKIKIEEDGLIAGRGCVPG